MGLFQRQPLHQSLKVPYTIGVAQTRRILIVGLGNPGKKYERTRHNIGFLVLDSLAASLDFPSFTTNKDFKADISEHTIGDTKVILAKPTTYMNESGQAVQRIAHFYKIPLQDIVVIHDELSIKFGQIRMRVGGQSAGHNGVQSVIQQLGPEFGRIRIGIKNEHTPKDDTSSFVLGTFSAQEKPHVASLVNEASLVANEYIYGGTLPHDTRSIILL